MAQIKPRAMTNKKRAVATTLISKLTASENPFTNVASFPSLIKPIKDAAAFIKSMVRTILNKGARHIAKSTRNKKMPTQFFIIRAEPNTNSAAPSTAFPTPGLIDVVFKSTLLSTLHKAGVKKLCRKPIPVTSMTPARSPMRRTFSNRAIIYLHFSSGHKPFRVTRRLP